VTDPKAAPGGRGLLDAWRHHLDVTGRLVDYSTNSGAEGEVSNGPRNEHYNPASPSLSAG